MSKNQRPNSFDNYFSEPQYYTDTGHVFKASNDAMQFNQEMAIEYFVNWLMNEWQWIPRDNCKYVFREVRQNIENGWVKWHGFIDDENEMRNGWVLYHEWKGGQKGFKHVYHVHVEKHFIVHGHHFEPLLSDWGMQYHSSCATCGRLERAKLQGAHAELVYMDEAAMFAGKHIKEAAASRKAALEKELSYYDGYK